MNQASSGDAEPATGETRLEIYTDGSSLGNPGPSGWGFVAVLLDEGGNVVEEAERSASGSKITTNNRAELAAAIAAMGYANKAHPGTPVTILSDSQYLVKGFTEWLPGWKARGWRNSSGKAVENQDLWERLESAAEGQDVSWRWVEAHRGHAYNERADALARTAAERARPSGFAKRSAA
ncbi:ribonuclease H family protein [Paracoccus homiensis]|uniref:Ribonuclease H n=1 Tax=Paracoccus homiensis TaxID=364199 RepID=A0A1I0BNV0_9RHOB|nr:ribonuclease H [Paracoccus homiensis]SET08611.1 ribonuclease HI [Paracoccus homiensis]